MVWEMLVEDNWRYRAGHGARVCSLANAACGYRVPTAGLAWEPDGNCHKPASCHCSREDGH